ncbi:MAG TPA: excinuclease ABC subunit UvrB [bacterium]|nr:excinuclease ABC subunit UvrB [bacterium]HOL48664.1 excinuclease ABC subunit UvrB [bacterium]HPQ20033.1 excinuclease ABC subunit UvrB [bacterium]
MNKLNKKFKLYSEFKPAGDQPEAIDKLTDFYLQPKNKRAVLLGVTGSGKTFTMANLINNLQLPTLVISHNKTLAAQLYDEFKSFFPENAVEYFVSFYDYYQPEAYIPQTDTYIEKESDINEEIDRLRLSATSSLIYRNDVIIVASVSCIYGLGSPVDYKKLILYLSKGERIDQRELIERLLKMQYSRNDTNFTRGTFRVRGYVIDIFPAYGKDGIRIELLDDEIDRLFYFHPVSGNIISEEQAVSIFPAKHFVMEDYKLEDALVSIERELEEWYEHLIKEKKLLEAQRIKQRTEYDLEMLREMGYCNGIENYSRHLSGRPPGSRPYTLFDYFPDDFLVIIDESHQTIPQIRGMYAGDYSRKQVLVDYGFRLPSALDNRPLKFEEFEEMLDRVLYVSATPAEYEKKKSKIIVEQIIRPTGLVDPEIIIKPTKNQIDDLIEEIRKCIEKKQRVLVTTLTIEMAEKLTEYLKKLNIKVQYLHSKIHTLDRVEILTNFRAGEFDVLVGINLLREGLDLPEVSVVAILDADIEGFLRSETSLIQIAGRAARNIDGRVILYADKITKSIKNAVAETNRRRTKQLEYNKKNNITPKSIEKEIRENSRLLKKRSAIFLDLTQMSKEEQIKKIEKEMELAAHNLDFETAAVLRDILFNLKGVKRTK